MRKQLVMSPVGAVDAHQLASAIRSRIENILIIDSRSFIEHNSCHITSAVNVCCSKIVKRRLQQDKLSVKELLVHTCHCDVDENLDVVVYDQSSKDSDSLPVESFTVILLKKLQFTFHSVNLLSGGFEVFQKFYPDLCEDKTRKCLTSLSQPCLPIANQGPTRILPFLYLGSQLDALNKELLRDHNITYELNVSTSCPQPEFVSEGHFMRIPVNDTYNEKLLPYFPDAFNFLDKVREGSGCVLVHCLAGISRSPTVAIAYVMRYLHLSSDDGYRYVKSKRPTISPNFNFLGQLLEYEKQLRRENILDNLPEVSSAPPLCSKKRLCRTDMRTSKLSLDIDLKKNELPNLDPSPTTALAKLSFDVPNNEEDTESCRQSKVLSPVKEIKCDALISEISTGRRYDSKQFFVEKRFSSNVKYKEQPRKFVDSEKRTDRFVFRKSFALHTDSYRRSDSSLKKAEQFRLDIDFDRNQARKKLFYPLPDVARSEWPPKLGPSESHLWDKDKAEIAGVPRKRVDSLLRDRRKFSVRMKIPESACETDQMGLYRAQSCPGILSHVCALVDKNYLNAQETHESCPDVLRLPDSWGQRRFKSRDFYSISCK